MAQSQAEVIVALLFWWLQMAYIYHRVRIIVCLVAFHRYRPPIRQISYRLDFEHKRIHLRQMVYSSDNMCYNQIRMYRSTFDRLCSMLVTIRGLKNSSNMLVDEQVAMFLHILAHHVKNRVIQFEFGRLGETVSRYFHMVLKAMMRLGGELFKVPDAIPEDATDERWKWFKGCLGALDGTHIRIKVAAQEKPRYRNRKGEITTNVLGVCSPNEQFIYVLPGWEGSTADGRVLRDAISRANGPLKVPHGNYYLVDAGYTNCEGFLAPFRGQRYHLSEWRNGRQPDNARECFNMKHSSARNVIERCFGMLKARWSILRSPSFYPVKTHNRVIMACCMLHNFIKCYNASDPLEEEIGELEGDISDPLGDGQPISSIEPSDAWSNWREALANDMYNDFRGRQGQ